MLKEFIFSNIIIIAGDEITSSRFDKLYPNFFSYFQGKFKTFIAFIAVLFGKKVVFYKIGLYSFQKNYPKKLLLFALEKSKQVIVRDAETKKNLESLGLKREIVVMKDPGYDLQYKKQKKKKSIGLALSDPLDIEKENQLIEFIRKLIFIKKNYKFLFFIFGQHPKLKSENDQFFTKRVISKLDTNFRYKIFDEKNPIKVKSKVSSMSFFITTRYHGGVFADSTGVPFIAIPVSGKLRTFGRRTIEFSALEKVNLNNIK